MNVYQWWKLQSLSAVNTLNSVQMISIININQAVFLSNTHFLTLNNYKGVMTKYWWHFLASCEDTEREAEQNKLFATMNKQYKRLIRIRFWFLVGIRLVRSHRSWWINRQWRFIWGIIICCSLLLIVINWWSAVHWLLAGPTSRDFIVRFICVAIYQG